LLLPLVSREPRHGATSAPVAPFAVDGGNVGNRPIGRISRATPRAARFLGRPGVAIRLYGALFDAVRATGSHCQDRPLRSLQSALAVLTNPAKPLR
jgi:hypothetical protein